MSLIKSDQQVAVYTKQNSGTKDVKEKKIVDEETYTDNLQNIIQRDFFPDLSKLQAQSEYFEAIEKNDLVKLREIQIKYGPRRPTTGASSLYTPSTFETPDVSAKQSSPTSKKKGNNESSEGEVITESLQNQELNGTEKSNSKGGLDSYLAKYTSEDNASFEEILKESDRKHRDKHSWLYESETTLKEAQESRLALPSIEQQAAIKSGPANLDMWEYKTQNAVMYIPDGVEKSEKEKLQDKKHKPRQILHDNTRFQFDPHNMQKSKQMLKDAASEKAQANYGKIGHDGKEIVTAPSPQINGFGFVHTPSPAPGVEDSPLMTWGEIEGTPFRLDAGDTPTSNSQGPSFKIPDVPKRDRLAKELSEKASKAHRAKKQQALKQATRNFSSPSPKFGASNTDKLMSMSPAAQRLATMRLGIRTNTDRALRDSYSPSPSHSLQGDKTPISLTPSSTPNSIIGGSTPGSERGTKRDGEVTSLTDNLLQIPKRPKASDFFS